MPFTGLCGRGGGGWARSIIDFQYIRVSIAIIVMNVKVCVIYALFRGKVKLTNRIIDESAITIRSNSIYHSDKVVAGVC